MLDNSMALTAVSNLFGPDMIPAIIHQVIEKLKHARLAIVCINKTKSENILYRATKMKLLIKKSPRLEPAIWIKHLDPPSTLIPFTSRL